MMIYLDSNVPGYAGGAGEATPQKRRDSRQLIRLARRGLAEAVASPLTVLEILQTPLRRVRRRSMRWLNQSRVRILPREWAEPVDELARRYLSRGAVPPTKEGDARHLAWATLAEADVLVSWNRSDLVRLKTRRLAAIINVAAGYRLIAVEFPTEVVREIEGR